MAERARYVFLSRPFPFHYVNEKAAPCAPLLRALAARVLTGAGDPAAEAQAGSALILEEVNRPTVQLASSAASPRALFAEFGSRLQVAELLVDVNGAVTVGADALGERLVSIVTKLL